MKIQEMTSNQFYGILNKRFDQREKELLGFGYVRQVVPGLNIAVYTRTRHGKIHAVQTGTMHHATKRAWTDVIDECKRFCASY